MGRLLQGAEDRAGPVLLQGALSPIFRNNPSFRLVEYDPSTQQPLDYTVYYSDMPVVPGGKLHWRIGYNARQAYAAIRRNVNTAGAMEQASFRALGDELGEGGS